MSFGQELNDQTFAICKADMLIKGNNADFIKDGNTLSDDQFEGQKFDYIISNPPFGREWKNEKRVVEDEAKRGFAGRFGAGLPAASDGQMLFLMTAISKMKEPRDGGSRIAIIHNGSPLFTGDAGSGPSDIRKYILESDLLEAIIALPNDIFYNTGIATYIWVLSNKKAGGKETAPGGTGGRAGEPSQGVPERPAGGEGGGGGGSYSHATPGTHSPQTPGPPQGSRDATGQRGPLPPRTRNTRG